MEESSTDKTVIELPQEMWVHICKYLNAEDAHKKASLRIAEVARHTQFAEELTEVLDYMIWRIEEDTQSLNQIREKMDRSIDHIESVFFTRINEVKRDTNRMNRCAQLISVVSQRQQKMMRKLERMRKRYRFIADEDSSEEDV